MYEDLIKPFQKITGVPYYRGHTIKLILELTHNNIHQHSFSYRTIFFWNGLPNDIVVADNLNSFKSKIDYYIANNVV